MKTISKFMLGGLLAAGLSCAAQAQTYVYLAGSTAFRGQTNAAIMHALGSSDYSTSTGAGTLPSGSYYAYNGTSGLGKANSAIFSGTIGGVQVIVKTTWTGSESGIWSLAADSGAGGSIKYLLDTQLGTNNAGTNGLTDPATLSGASVDTHAPNVAMADTYQATSQFAGGNTIVYADATSHVMATLSEVSGGTYGTAGPVGVTYFAFYTTKQGKLDGLTNITSEQAKALYKNGSLPLTWMLPATSNTTAQIYAFGRDPDSGTRLSVIGEIGLGNLGAVNQYYPYDSGNNIMTAAGTLSYIDIVPASTVNFVAVNSGNGGYSSGGSLSKALNSDDTGSWLTSAGGSANTPGSCGIFYAGISDGNNTTNGQQLTFNGVAPSDSNVQNGNYPLWTYEHMYLGVGISTNAKTVAQTIATQLKNTDASGTGCVFRTSMKVKRTGSKDGGSVFATGTF